jgi:hypothetical protein
VDPDELMDLAVSSAEDILGRSITYTPLSTGVAVTFSADFREPGLNESTAGQADYATVEPHLDCRAQTLEDLPLVPAKGDAVAFTVRGVSRSYKVTGVERPAPETVHIILGIRS